MKVQTFVLISLVFTVLIMCPVVAWSDSMNNGGVTYSTYTLTGTTTVTWGPRTTSYLDTYCAYMTANSGFLLPTSTYGTATDYWAATVMYPGTYGTSYAQYGAWDSSNSLIYYKQDSGVFGGGSTTLHRVEIVRTSSTSTSTYLDGVLEKTYTTSTSQPYNYGIGVFFSSSAAYPCYIDDISSDNSFSDTAIVSVMPHTDSIQKSILSPTNVLLKDASGNTLYSDHFNIQWSLGPQADGWNMTTAPNTRYAISIFTPSGYQAYTGYINITAAGAAAGIISVPFNSTYIANLPLEYGIYHVYLYDGGGTKSDDYFSVISSGASIYWGSTLYAAGSTATVTWNVDTGYWDTSDYDYAIKVVDIYGNTKATSAVTAQSGTTSFSLIDYDAGVYYAELTATPTTGGTEAVLYYAATEVTAYLYLSGHIMNEETGAVISGARVNVTQSGTTVSYTSDSSGAWGNSSQYWLTGPSIYLAASESGFYGYSGSFTPLAAGNIVRNISMQPLNESYSGVAINGVDSDTQYGNPIPNATIYLRVNGTSDTPQQTFTNIAGYYIFNNLVNGVTYDIWPEKTGFLNSVGLRQVTARGG